MAYRRGGGSGWSKPERSYNERTRAGIIKGMIDYWQDAVSGGSASLDALITGETTDTPRQLPGYDLGTELGAMLRGIVRRGTIAGVTTDELGYLVAGQQQTLTDAALNVAGAAVAEATGGLVNPGDAGGVEDELLSWLGV